jgi:hypothetical protein
MKRNRIPRLRLENHTVTSKEEEVIERDNMVKETHFLEEEEKEEEEK